MRCVMLRFTTGTLPSSTRKQCIIASAQFLILAAASALFSSMRATLTSYNMGTR